MGTICSSCCRSCRNVRKAAEDQSWSTSSPRRKGLRPRRSVEDKYHGVSKFNVLHGRRRNQAKARRSRVFADSLIAEAKKDAKIVAITAAMPDGTASIASPRNS